MNLSMERLEYALKELRTFHTTESTGLGPVTKHTFIGLDSKEDADSLVEECMNLGYRAVWSYYVDIPTYKVTVYRGDRTMSRPLLAVGLNALALSAPAQPTLKEHPALYGARCYVYGHAVKGYMSCTLPVVKTRVKAEDIAEYFKAEGCQVDSCYAREVRGWLIRIEWSSSNG